MPTELGGNGSSSPANDVTAARVSGSSADEPENLRELRLALVLPGGVSLAVYIHGVVAEIHRLVRASMLDEIAAASTTPSGVMAVYSELLRTVRAGEINPIRTRVVVDVIAGTSAGGVNAVFLAKALAHNLPLGFLRDLWIKQADINRLLRGPTFLPRRLRMPWIAATLPWRSPLRGDTILRWLHDALEQMDQAGPMPVGIRTLLPNGHTLQLFVTLTDLGGLKTTDTVLGPKLTHRHVLSFRYSPGGVDDFQPEANDDLAFAARATASFPGAFPPVRLAELRDALRGEPSHGLTALLHDYTLADADPEATAFIDGGILDNRPFRAALRGLQAAAPAAFEVDRRVLYVDPVERNGQAQPEALRTDPVHVLGALARIVGTELPDEVEEVRRGNEQSAELRHTIEGFWELIDMRLREIVGRPDLFLEDEEEWRRADAMISEAAARDSGFAYVTYFHLRIRDTLGQLSRVLAALNGFPEASRQHRAIASILHGWGVHVGLRKMGPDPDEQQRHFVGSVDLGFDQRRLLFTRMGLNLLYRRAGYPGAPPREEVDMVKSVLSDGLTHLDPLASGPLSPELSDAISALFDGDIVRVVDPTAANEFARTNADEISGIVESLASALASPREGVRTTVWRTLTRATAAWGVESRKHLAVRFMGFPLWDVLLYPIQAVTGVTEAAQPPLTRLSPSGACVLSQAQKLLGTSRHHFGAFYSRRARENDYLWGRLDGAEHLVTLLLGAESPEHARWCHRLFLAVLEEEEPALPKVRNLIAGLREQLMRSPDLSTQREEPVT